MENRLSVEPAQPEQPDLTFEGERERGGVLVSGILELRAIRERLTLTCADGVRLSAELSLPLGAAPATTVIWVHPLPEDGGSQDTHLIRKAALRLPELAGVAVLRFNTRGTSSPLGTSEGVFGNGEEERYDLAAAYRCVQERGLPAPWLIGWSFGADVVLKHGTSLAQGNSGVAGAVLLSPTLRRSSDTELTRWNDPGEPPLHVLIPELDHLVSSEEVLTRLSRVPRAVSSVLAEGTHLWAGERRARIVLDRITQLLVPEVGRLPERVGEHRLAQHGHTQHGFT